jgi:hypothetical protein
VYSRTLAQPSLRSPGFAEFVGQLAFGIRDGEDADLSVDHLDHERPTLPGHRPEPVSSSVRVVHEAPSRRIVHGCVRALRWALHLTRRDEVQVPLVCVKPKGWNCRRKFVETFSPQEAFEADRDLGQRIEQQRRVLHHHSIMQPARGALVNTCAGDELPVWQCIETADDERLRFAVRQLDRLPLRVWKLFDACEGIVETVRGPVINEPRFSVEFENEVER